jgi:hypothetical protein
MRNSARAQVTATEYQLLTIKLDNFFVSGSDDDFEALACLLYEVALDSQERDTSAVKPSALCTALQTL